jgi:hypothetical protein
MSQGIDAMRKIIREKEPVRPSTRLTQELVAADVSPRKSASGLAVPTPEEVSADSRRRLRLREQIHCVRGDLDWIVMKCLEKDRTRRYETANGLARDLQRHINNEAVQARPPSNLYRLQKMVRRHRAAFAATALMALVLVAATGISTWQAARATRAEALAKERLTESEEISKFLTEVFQSPDPARDGRAITVAEILGAAAKKLETDLSSQAPLRVKFQATLGSTYCGLGLYGDAILLQEKVLDHYVATLGLENTNTVRAISSLASYYDRAGRLDEALKLQEQELTLSLKVFGPDKGTPSRP